MIINEHIQYRLDSAEHDWNMNRRDEKMAEIPDKVTSIIDRFLKALAKKNILIEQAILFGSYTHGSFNDWSDIDLDIVSQAFEGDRWVERILTLKQTCRSRSLPVFPLLVDAIKCYFKEQKPDLAWLA